MLYMRILQVSNKLEGGGTSVVMCSLARALSLRGHEVHFAVSQAKPSRNIYKIRHLGGIPFHLLRRILFFNEDPMACRSFEKIIKETEPDIIHCHNLASFPSLEIIKASHDRKIPCVVTIHDYWPVCLNRNLVKGRTRDRKEPDPKDFCRETGWTRCARDCKWESLKKIPNIPWGMSDRRRLLSLPNVQLVTVSNYVKNVMVRFGYSPIRIKVIYNGVDTEALKPRPGHKKRLVLYLGGNSRKKGVAHFIAIAEKIRKFTEDIDFIAFGGDIPQLPGFIKNLGWSSFDNLIGFYQDAACVCFPSLIPEPFPLVPIESMACGTPVVAYALGGVIELVKNDETGFLIEHGDVNRMSERILSLTENEDLTRKMGLNGRKIVEENFTLERMCDNYERLYKEISI